MESYTGWAYVSGLLLGSFVTGMLVYQSQDDDIELNVPKGLGNVVNVEAVQDVICSDLETQLNAQWKRHAEAHGLPKSISFECKTENSQSAQLAPQSP